MIVGETLAGIFLLGSFFASFFTGPQRGSETCTTSFKNIKKKNAIKKAEIIARSERLFSTNQTDMVKRARSNVSKSAVRRTLSTKSKTKSNPTSRRGGMRNNLKCLLHFIRSSFSDYDVEMDGVIINNLDDNEVLIIVNDFLQNHKKDLVDVVQNELPKSVSDKKIMDKINSVKNDITKNTEGFLKSTQSMDSLTL